MFIYSLAKMRIFDGKYMHSYRLATNRGENGNLGQTRSIFGSRSELFDNLITFNTFAITKMCQLVSLFLFYFAAAFLNDVEGIISVHFTNHHIYIRYVSL